MPHEADARGDLHATERTCGIHRQIAGGQLSESENDQGSVLELSVSRDDLGKIIGKQGRTARAIRTILGAVSAKTKKRVVLEILE